MEPLNKNKKNKRVLLVVSHRDFRDEEYFIPRAKLEEKGVVVDVASSDVTPAVSIKGTEVNVDIVLQDVHPEIYDAILVVGGRGVRSYFDDTDFHGLLNDFNEKEKVIGAICAAPVILAKAGLLKGKKATVWFTAENNEYPEILKMSGVDFSKDPVVVDGNIITASTPEVASEFADTVISLFK